MTRVCSANSWLLASLLWLTACSGKREAPPAAAAYADPKLCAGCHGAIARTYAQTGMGRSFYRATAATMNVEGWDQGARVDHELSGRSYQMLRRDGRYFLRRWQKGFDGRESNVLEAEIHYVMGSGNHARSYLHRTPQGRLAELPVSWYASGNGGFLAMSPGYDRAAHFEFRRKISTDCLFCHNAAPAADMAPASEPVFSQPLAEGIDCQRCHGPGRAHAEAAGRAPIVNSAKLDRDRGMEVCMQCHLETTSFPLPNSLVRFGRGAFSFRPGEPLADFTLHFDHAAGTGREEKFEIVNSVYRLRQSACFQRSGKLQCTTCHNPHAVVRGAAAVEDYSKACLGCHAAHTKSKDCVGCHMPKRRTEDVVHAVMTDHKIQRHAPPNPLKPIPERHETPGKSYVGEVALYYPPALADQRDRDLYLAVAQVVQKSNLQAGIPRLEAAIEKYKPADPRFRFALAEAYTATGDRARAMEIYQSLTDFVPAIRNLGQLLTGEGRAAEAIAMLEKGAKLVPANSGVLHALGEAYRSTGRLDDARVAFEQAVAQDPDFPEPHNSLGGVWAEKKDLPRAEAEFREAIRHQPDYAAAHLNLAHARMMAGDLKQGTFHYHTAARMDPSMAEAHEALGTIFSARGDIRQAIERYRLALRARPDFDRAHLGLGSVLAATGDLGAARNHLQKAAASADEEVRREAVEGLKLLAGPSR